jgi:uncharacterized repeat protein (TIGR03803 family)
MRDLSQGRRVRRYGLSTLAISLFLLAGYANAAVTQLHKFGWPQGRYPFFSPIQASDGNFYGVTVAGGANGCGTVYRMTPAGATSALASFDCVELQSGLAALVQGSNGDLYGVSYRDKPAVYKVTLSGVLTKLVSLPTNVGWVDYGLTLGNDGNFYGVTLGDGWSQQNPVFYRVTPSGQLSILYTFADPAAQPQGLLLGPDGNFYGTTESNNGTVFRVTPTGTFTTLASLTSATGYGPVGKLVPAAGGGFYGTTTYGGANNSGTIYRVMPDGTLTVIHPFSSTTGYVEGLTYGADGNAYVVANEFLRMTPAGVVTKVADLPSSVLAPLVLGKDGRFYGIHPGSGSAADGGIFRITTDGVFTPLFDFIAPAGAAAHSLIFARDGNFYGTASNGPSGYGTVFRIGATDSVEAFANLDQSTGPDPVSALLQVANGDFYGTSSGDSSHAVNGVMYRMTSGGTIARLAYFGDDDSDGHDDTPAQGTDGNFYGTSSRNLYSVSPSGAIQSAPIHYGPVGNLVRGSDGALYGITNRGGSGGAGFFYKVSASGAPIEVASLDYMDAGQPTGLIESGDGNFYGVGTGYSGQTDRVFRITPAGVLSVLATVAPGDHLGQMLMRSANGNFFLSAGNGSGLTPAFAEMTPAGMLLQIPSSLASVTALAEDSVGNIYGLGRSTRPGGQFDPQIAFKIDAPPSPPAHVSATTGANSLQVTWDTVAGATAYDSYLDTLPGSPSPSRTRTATPSQSLTNLDPGTRYYMTIRSVRDSVFGAASAEVSAVTPGPIAATLALSPLSMTRALGSPHCVAAAARDASNNAVANITLSFSRTGVTPGSGSVKTDASGIGQICWAAPRPGTDSMRVWHGTLSANAAVTWVQAPSKLVTSALFTIGSTPGGFVVNLNPTATLTQPVSGSPIAGRKVTFTANGKFFCEGFTDDNGKIRCVGAPLAHLSAIPNGVRADFYGDQSYKPSSATGPLICAGSVCALH